MFSGESSGGLEMLVVVDTFVLLLSGATDWTACVGAGNALSTAALWLPAADADTGVTPCGGAEALASGEICASTGAGLLSRGGAGLLLEGRPRLLLKVAF